MLLWDRGPGLWQAKPSTVALVSQTSLNWEPAHRASESQVCHFGIQCLLDLGLPLQIPGTHKNPQFLPAAPHHSSATEMCHLCLVVPE